MTKNLDLFHKAAKEIPAYQAFLLANGVDPSNVQTADDLQKIPATSKKNYLVPNSFEDLVWQKDQQAGLLLCATSGSTGEPYYFPRNDELSNQYSYALESFLKSSSYGTGNTLVIVGFGMGVWIGGVITMRAFELAATRANLPVSILPTGYNKTEIFKALKKLAPKYSQTVIVGYPPFIKELVDEAPSEDVNLADLHIRFLFAAESFTETFRNFVCEKAGIPDPVRNTLNIYGSADIGAMANETPLSIFIRRQVIEKPDLYGEIFNYAERTPTLAQFNPEFITFEEVDGELFLTGNGALPLIRYAIGDHGGVVSYDVIQTTMQKHGINLDDELVKAGLSEIVEKDHPFVYVYERVDMSVTLHGLNIYPEFIKEALLLPEFAELVTERFTMATKYDARHNQFLQVNVEMQAEIKESEELLEKIKQAIHQSLVQRSSEFAEVAKSRKADELIQIILWEKGHPRYFAPGTKQKWVEKQ